MILICMLAFMVLLNEVLHNSPVKIYLMSLSLCKQKERKKEKKKVKKGEDVSRALSLFVFCSFDRTQ